MGFFDLLNFKKEGKDGKSFFWETMEKCDWQFEGDDEKVLEPVISYLSEQSDELIFQEIISIDARRFLDTIAMICFCIRGVLH